MSTHVQNLVSEIFANEERRLDANETNAFARELEAVKVAVVEYEYPMIKWDQFIPLEAGVDPGADTFTWYEFDRVGLAKTIANYATDLPLINSFGKKNNSNIENEGAAYKYSIQDVRASALYRRPLQTRMAVMAREAIERQIEHILVKGDAATNRPGLARNANVTVIDGSTTLTGDWDNPATTGQMIYDDVNAIIWSVRNASFGRHDVTTIAMGRIPFQYLSTKSMTTLDSDSALTKVKAANPGVQFEIWSELDTADAAGTGPRIIAYEKSPEVLGAIVPVRFQSEPEQRDNLNFKVPVHARVGGTVVYRPLAMVYVDNIML